MATAGWLRKFNVYLPAALLILLVLAAGTQRFSIQNTAGYLAPVWFRHFGSLPYQRFWQFVEALRKLGHLAGYGLVCLAFFGVSYRWVSRRPSSLSGWGLKNRAAGWALLLTMVLGSADEFHQRFVPQRTSTITDVGFDVCGGYFALMIVFAALRRRARRVVPQPAATAAEQATV